LGGVGVGRECPLPAEILLRFDVQILHLVNLYVVLKLKISLAHNRYRLFWCIGKAQIMEEAVIKLNTYEAVVPSIPTLMTFFCCIHTSSLALYAKAAPSWILKLECQILRAKRAKFFWILPPLLSKFYVNKPTLS
jgi:hypothetical protein